MSLFRAPSKLGRRLFYKRKCFSTAASQNDDDEYTATPQYPEILDLSYVAKKKREVDDYSQEIRLVKTVEEKQIKLNMPRYYGFPTFMLLENDAPYDNLPLAQYVTRTHLISTKSLPEYYQNINVENLEVIVKDTEETLLMELDNIKRLHDLTDSKLTDVEKQDLIASAIVRSLNRVLNNNLSKSHPYIVNNEIDIDPRLEASWVVGGMNPSHGLKKKRSGTEFTKKLENDPEDRTMSYIGNPILFIRSHLPLPCVVSPSEAENPEYTVPQFKYDPRAVGIFIEQDRHIGNVPGFWPGDLHTFGLISFLKTGHMFERNQYLTDPEDAKEALHRQAVLSSYAWLYAQANYLGFTTYNDITYPLVTQTVLTDGQNFRFYVYQLNTIVMNAQYAFENKKNNLCWASDSFKLYEEVSNGKVVGLNPEVLSNLIKLYSNAPVERLGVNMRPYLSQEEQLSADYKDDMKRKWLEKEYKYLMSNRKRVAPVDEVYHWEKIYKIDHKMRPQEKRSRFFELFQNPYKRRLDDRPLEYVPRALRPDLPRHKGRNLKDYWP